MRRLAVGIVLLFLLAAAPTSAQQAPPARVGRVSFVSGQIAFHLAGETQWSAAALNYPVATGGSFWVDPQSRAEIRIGAQTLDLAPNSEVDITRLDEQVMQIAVPQGRIDLHLRQLEQGNTVEIDIPRGGVWLLQSGIYDIDAGSDEQPARIAVFEGSARFVGGPVDIGINPGTAAVIADTTNLTASIERAAPDAFYRWCRSRDYREEHLAAPHFVSPQMTGYAELDEYGTWGQVPDYGEVWYPRSVPADWAPYSEGRWVFIEPWGWTWTDDEPWGFAPFHYGRWARVAGRWAWVPGRFAPHPVYAPALVAFIGAPGVGVALAGVAGPAVGWFPLGPDEVYWPSYTRDPAYFRQVNIANVSETRIVNITNIVAKQRLAGPPPEVVNQTFANRAAATVVPVTAFAGAAPVARAARRVAPQTLRQAQISVQPPTVTPAPAARRPVIAHAPPVEHPAAFHAPPPAAHAPPVEHPAALHAPPPAVHAPPVEHPAAIHAPPPAAHAPPVERPAALHAPPPAAHAPPVEHPAVSAPPPAAHAPPVEHPAATHAPPPAAHAPPVERPAAGHGGAPEGKGKPKEEENR